jgi:hypothetical protein
VDGARLSAICVPANSGRGKTSIPWKGLGDGKQKYLKGTSHSTTLSVPNAATHRGCGVLINSTRVQHRVTTSTPRYAASFPMQNKRDPGALYVPIPKASAADHTPVSCTSHSSRTSHLVSCTSHSSRYKGNINNNNNINDSNLRQV